MLRLMKTEPSERVCKAHSHRIAAYLGRCGLIQRDMDNTFLDLPMDDEDSLLPLQAASAACSALQ